MYRFFILIYYTNIIIAFYLILVSFRVLAAEDQNIYHILLPMSQGSILILFSLVGKQLRNIANQYLLGTIFNLIPWFLVILNAGILIS